MDFLFGASFAIVVYCLLSALGVGKIAWMRLSVYALGVAALGFDFSSISCQCIRGWQTLSWMLDGRDKVSVQVIEAGNRRYCSQVGTFGTESAVKNGGSRNLPYLNAKPRQIPLLGTYA